MVLRTHDVRGSRQAVGRRAARGFVPVLGGFALEDKAFVKRAHNLFRTAKVLVVPLTLAGKECVDRVVEVVTPEGVETVPALSRWKHQPGIVAIGLGDHANLAAQLFGKSRNLALNLSENVDR